MGGYIITSSFFNITHRMLRPEPKCHCSELWNCVEELHPQDPEGVLLLYQACSQEASVLGENVNIQKYFILR